MSKKENRVVDRICDILQKEKVPLRDGQAALMAILVGTMVANGFSKQQFMKMLDCAWDHGEATMPEGLDVSSFWESRH